MTNKIKTSPDEISPVTGNKSVIVDVDPGTGTMSKLCMESGFTTNSFLINGTETVKNLEDTLPRVAFENRVTDSFNYVWIPMMQQTEKGIIFPTRSDESEQEFVWAVAEVKRFSEEEKLKYPNPKKPGTYMDSFVDIDNATEFNRNDFEKALEYFMELNAKE